MPCWQRAAAKPPHGDGRPIQDEEKPRQEAGFFVGLVFGVGGIYGLGHYQPFTLNY